MSGTQAYDAIVIGGGIAGLIAASYLAKGGKRVQLLEARNKLGGRCETAPIADGFSAPAAAHALYALDPRAVEELKLAKHGLSFAVRDMPRVALRAGTNPIVLGRDTRAAARTIAAYSLADARAFPEFRRTVFALARRMRATWWENGTGDPRANDCALLERLKRQSAAAWLDSWFETDALKAMLAMDVVESGLSPLEPGSGLALLWRASQEMCGLQGAVAVPNGGPGSLAQALVCAAQAAGVDIRTGVAAARLHADGDVAASVELESGEMLASSVVLSSLSRAQTLAGLGRNANVGLGEANLLARRRKAHDAAKIIFAISGLPPLRDTVLLRGRMIVVDRMESLVSAHEQARSGALPAELPLEIVIPTLTDLSLAPPGQHVVSVLVRPVPPATIDWNFLKAALVERVALAIERVMPEFARHIVVVKAFTPQDWIDIHAADGGLASASRILAPWDARIKTEIKGLYLCGASAEPADAISGRAARIAAAFANSEQEP